MAAISSIGLGTDSWIKVGPATTEADDQDTFDLIGGIYTGNFAVSHNVADATNNNDVGYTSMLIGNSTITLSFECRYDPTDDGQALVFAAGQTFGGGSFKAVKGWLVQPFGDDGQSFAFDGYITNVSLNAGENDAPVNMTVEVQGSGPSIDTTPTYDADGAPAA